MTPTQNTGFPIRNVQRVEALEARTRPHRCAKRCGQVANYSIEPLEARVAPAAVFINATTATFDDVDGDKVTVKFSKPILTSGNVGSVLFTAAIGLGDQLQGIDLTGVGSGAKGTTISISAKLTSATGDGLVNVGRIDATGIDLGAVTIKGDLGELEAGDAELSTAGLKSLNVHSLGRLGTSTGAANLAVVVAGSLGALKVKGDIVGTFVNVSGGSDTKIGSVIIGGSLLGGSSDSSGRIRCTGDIGLVRIGHDLVGGTGASSGLIGSDSKLAGVTIVGSLFGGSGEGSGEISSDGELGVVTIGHDVKGSSGEGSGSIASNGKINRVNVGGSLLGAAGGDGSSGRISANELGAIKIAGDLVGGTVSGTASLSQSGLIESDGRIASVFIGGSVFAGVDTSSGSLTKCGSIRAGNDIGSLVVKGSLVGNSANPVVISARGQATPGASADVAIGKISIGGRVELTNILAGYDTGLNPADGDAEIGRVKVAGDWIASNLAAGVRNPGADDAAGGTGINADNVNFGDIHDVEFGLGSITRIASIVIGGQVQGTVSGNDHFGFVAGEIGSLRIAGALIRLTANIENRALGVTGDVNLHELG